MLKLKLTPLCIALCLTGGLTGGVVSSAFAESDSSKVDNLIRKVNARTSELEREIKALRSQVAELKKEKVTQDKKIERVAEQKVGPRHFGPDILQMGVMPVITGPFVADIGQGLSLAPDGLVITLFGYNQDLGLLKQQQNMDKIFTARTGNPRPLHPLLQLSGRVETQLSGTRNANGSSSSDIDLTSAELDLTSRAGNWVTAFIAMAYDGSPTANGAGRVTNSRLFVDKAFLTIGNLNESPFYGTIGQRHVQFGQYVNPFITAPFTRGLGRTKARQISVSYQHPGDSGFYATAFTFRGDSRANQNLNQLGGSVGYEIKQDKWKANIGVDYISHIGDSDNIQRAFNNGAVNPTGSQQLVNRVPGIAVQAKVDVGPVAFVAEYIGATTSFNPANVSINGSGAKPQALHLAGIYSYTGLWNKSSELAIGYNQARDTQAFGIPQSRWSIVHNMVILKNTIFSLEYRRDKNYGLDVTRLQGNILNNVANANLPLGGYTQALTAQLVYLF
jgi:hypothetical protein